MDCNGRFDHYQICCELESCEWKTMKDKMIIMCEMMKNWYTMSRYYCTKYNSISTMLLNKDTQIHIQLNVNMGRKLNYCAHTWEILWLLNDIKATQTKYMVRKVACFRDFLILLFFHCICYCFWMKMCKSVSWGVNELKLYCMMFWYVLNLKQKFSQTPYSNTCTTSSTFKIHEYQLT